ncbi:MAG TPA: hypothetical protein VI231_11485, partial [Candidatus Binatia bacterium]
MARKEHTVTSPANRLARLLFKAPLLAALITLASPSAVLPPHNPTVQEKTSNAEATKNSVSVSTYATKAFSTTPSRKSGSRTQPQVSKIAKLPLYFEANDGQTDEQVKFLSRSRGYRLLLTASEAVLELQTPRENSARTRLARLTPGPGDGKDMGLKTEPAQIQTVRMKLVGASAEAKIIGVDELAGKSNYFIGNDPKKWRRNIPQYAKVRYEEVYPGIDLVFYGNDGQLEFDF